MKHQTIHHLTERQTDQLHQFVKLALTDFRRDHIPDREWLYTYLLSLYCTDERMAFDELEKLIKNTITAPLHQARLATSIIVNRDIEKNYEGYRDRYVSPEQFHHVLKAEIGAHQKNPIINIWSTLYHKYFVIHNLSDDDFAELAGVSSQQLHDYEQQGIQYLTQRLIDIEKRLYEKTQKPALASGTLIENEADHLIGLARSARGLHGEMVALQRCDDAMQYAYDNQLALYYVKAGALKVFILLQGMTNHVERAAQILQQLEQNDLIQSLTDPYNKAWIMVKISSMWSHIWRRRGNLEHALSSAHEAVHWLDGLHGADIELEKDTYTIRSVMYWASGLYAHAEQDLQYTLNSPHLYVYDILGMLGLTYWGMSKFDTAEQHFQQAIEQSQARKDLWHLACEQGNMGLVSLSQHRLQKSRQYVELHQQNAAKLNSWKEHSRATANLGIINLHEGNLSAAISLLEMAKNVYNTMSAFQSQVVIYVNLSQAYTLIGEHETALELANKALALSNSIIGAYPSRILALRTMAECEQVPTEQRIQYLETALDLAKPFRLFDQSACLLGLSWLESTPAKKSVLWDAGAQILHDIGASQWLEKSGSGYPHLLLIT